MVSKNLCTESSRETDREETRTWGEEEGEMYVREQHGNHINAKRNRCQQEFAVACSETKQGAVYQPRGWDGEGDEREVQRRRYMHTYI